jgi:flagellar assembly protein FliH
LSKIIKSNRLVVAPPSEPGFFESNKNISEPMNIISETEELVRVLLQKADRKANEIIDQAKAEVQELLVSAAEEAEKIKEQAYHIGYQDGKTAAEAQTEGMRQQILAEASRLYDEVASKKNSYLAEVKEEVVELAIDIAKKIIHQEITLEPETISAIVNNVLIEANPNKQDRLIMQVSPDNLQGITEAIRSNKISWPADRLEVETNPDLAYGSCVIIAPGGTYQLLIEESIDKIKELFLGAEIYE